MKIRSRRRCACLIAVVLGLVDVASGVPARAAEESANYIVVVNGERAVDVVSDWFDQSGVDVVAELKGSVDLVTAQLDAGDLADITHRPGIRRVEPDAAVRFDSDQLISSNRSTDNWGLDRIDQSGGTLDNHFRYGSTGAGVDIYVLDTGIRRSHTEFTGRVATGYWVPTINVGGSVRTLTSTDDDCGHGSHVAGIAAGANTGVAKAATIVPVKIFPGGSEAICEAGTTVTAAIAGINWVLANRTVGKPAVANLSLGVSGTNSGSGTLDDAVQNLAAVMPVIVAAGNEGSLTTAAGYIDVTSSSTAASPACTSRKPDTDRANQLTPSILTVAAAGGVTNSTFTGTDIEAYYSNHGSCVDIFAPGTDIRSTWPYAGATPNAWGGTLSDSAYYNNTGTSMATPFVTGAAAMLLQQTPSATPSEITSRILANGTRNALTLQTRVGSATSSPNLLLYSCATNCVPSAPKNVAVTRTSRTEMNVSWEAPDSDGGAAIASYTATATATGVATVTCSATIPATSCKLTGLNAGSSYVITVAATNTAGSGASSTAKSLSAGTVASAPGTPTVVAANGEVAVSWTAPSDNGGLPVSKYTVTSSPDGKTCSATGTELTCTVRELTNGTKYTFVVTATNDAGDSVSAASAAVVPIIPWAYVPAFDNVVPGNAKVVLSWTEARVTGTAPAGYFTGYVVKDSTGAVVCTTTALSCTVSGLKNATKVRYTVAATTIADTSQAATSADVLVGGLRQLANAMRKKSAAYLSKLAATNSKGKATWRAISGGCRISGKIIYAPATGKSCKIRVSVAKSGAFPAQTLNLAIRIL